MQRGLAPAGFLLAALGLAATGILLRDGGDGGVLLHVAFVVIGTGLSLGFSPTLTGALATVRPEHAADASGLLATVTQLGQLIGVASFGSLYLNRLEAPGLPGAQHSADAVLVCCCALSAASVLVVLCTMVVRRR